MASVAKSLRSQYPADQLYILNAKRNSGSFTYDGIELGGERLCVEIEEELQVIESKGGKIKKLSFVGYSLGGLVARYAVGVLYAKGILDQFECMVCCCLREFTLSLGHSCLVPFPRKFGRINSTVDEF